MAVLGEAAPAKRDLAAGNRRPWHDLLDPWPAAMPERSHPTPSPLAVFLPESHFSQVNQVRSVKTARLQTPAATSSSMMPQPPANVPAAVRETV